MEIDGVAALRADRGLDLSSFLVPDVAEDDLCSFTREQDRLGGALPSRAAADQCHFSLELPHGLSLRSAGAGSRAPAPEMIRRPPAIVDLALTGSSHEAHAPVRSSPSILGGCAMTG